MGVYEEVMRKCWREGWGGLSWRRRRIIMKVWAGVIKCLNVSLDENCSYQIKEGSSSRRRRINEGVSSWKRRRIIMKERRIIMKEDHQEGVEGSSWRRGGCWVSSDVGNALNLRERLHHFDHHRSSARGVIMDFRWYVKMRMKSFTRWEGWRCVSWKLVINGSFILVKPVREDRYVMRELDRKKICHDKL